MLLSHRKTAIGSLGASVETRAVVHTQFRLHHVKNERVVCEDALFMHAFERKGRVDRPVLTVVLAGRARVRAFGEERWLGPGEIVLVRSKSAIEMRQEGERYESLALEWDPGSLGTMPRAPVGSARLDRAGLRRLAACAESLASKDAAEVSQAFARCLRVLRAEGAPFEPREVGDLVEPVSESTQHLSRALDVVLSNLERGPAACDLEAILGLSARQTQRVVAAFNERYGFNSQGWRDTRNRRRLMVGASLMTAEGTTTELVSQATGYRTPTSFCHALAQAGIVSPGEVPRAVRDLL